MNLAEVTRRDCESLAMFSVSSLDGFEQHAVSFVVERKIEVIGIRLPAPAREYLIYLADLIRNEFIVPSLTECDTRHAYLQFWSKSVKRFSETLKAYRLVLNQDLKESSSPVLTEMRWESLKKDIRSTLTKLAGEEAVDECDFCFSTAERTERLIARFGSMDNPKDPTRDLALLGDYSRASILFTIGLFSLTDIVGGVNPRNEEILGEVLVLIRQGALNGYAAAREAYSLRQNEEITSEDVLSAELFSDAGDVTLANATIEDAGRITEMCEVNNSGR